MCSLQAIASHIYTTYGGEKVSDQKLDFHLSWIHQHGRFTLNMPIETKVVCFSHLLKCVRRLYGKQCGLRSDCFCSGYTLFASILNSSVMLGNYLQQTTSADDIFRCIFFSALQGLSYRYACTMACLPVRGDNPRALASGLSYVQVDKHGITILYHLHKVHQCRPCTS